MSEMVERVARAVAAADWRAEIDEASEPERWLEAAIAYDLTNDNGRFRYDEIARAAIEAMREPTEAMIDAGYAVGYSPDPLPTDLVWRAMIDAALPNDIEKR